MQLTLDLPDQLAEQLAALPDPQGFVIDLLAKSLTGGLSQDEWWAVLQQIEVVGGGTTVTGIHNPASGNANRRRRSIAEVSQE